METIGGAGSVSSARRRLRIGSREISAMVPLPEPAGELSGAAGIPRDAADGTA
jgi:hypothetical protein